MVKNILVTGDKGQLGNEIKVLSVDVNNCNFYFIDRDNLDITDREALESFCKDKSIHIIINCAAYTAVDQAESDVETANEVNHLAVKTMAQIAKKESIRLIHISTDYVFDGENYRPYLENDVVNPQGVYGETKLEGENAILKENPEGAVIIRTSWVYSSFGNNFVKTMLRLAKERDELGIIFDQVGTPTYAKHLAETILHIVHNNTKAQESVEIYHYSNEGVCSWYDFAKAIFELSDITCKVNAIKTAQYPTPAKRPHYSVLDKEKIKSHYQTLEIPYWKDGLKECLSHLS
ncbi:MAG: dTDP-4-dehydrorhamnose reductase (EC [uncultured Sulfurovum sp.]|uniref:dTDP-4-dehydrorhamnose reductase n=1 Tax=uncultured Sulfurovum sp. TaxID=269237 RepID=A0A6S6TUC1_9BACT|nr:MAG: dTDP-4-dehydrorhamnose reductase (EC [uncultured Sulfurovum sp.]